MVPQKLYFEYRMALYNFFKLAQKISPDNTLAYLKELFMLIFALEENRVCAIMS